MGEGATKRFDVLVAGDANPDVVLAGAPAKLTFGQAEQLVGGAALTVGGSAAIVACGAARLGLRTALIAMVGDDDGGRFMRECIASRGVDAGHVAVHPTLPTGLSVLLVRRSGDRAILTSRGCMDELSATAIPDDLLRHARHLHVSSFYLLPRLAADLAGLFARAREAGLTTSLDTNWDPHEKWLGLDQVLPLTDVLLPNENEALALAAALPATPGAAPDAPRDAAPGPSPDAAPGLPPQALARALATLNACGPLTVAKCGAQGAVALSDGELVRAAAPHVAAVDSAGAGDSFDAGFLAGYLAELTLDQSLGLACACGALSTRAAGGVDAQPTREEAWQAAGLSTT